MSTIILCAIIIFIAAIIVRKMLHDRKNKDCGCGCGSCKGCH